MSSAEMSNSNLTPADGVLLSKLGQCLTTTPQYDLEKLSKLLGHTNKGSTRNAVAALFKKLGFNKTTGAGPGPMTPKSNKKTTVQGAAMSEDDTITSAKSLKKKAYRGIKSEDEATPTSFKKKSARVSIKREDDSPTPIAAGSGKKRKSSAELSDHSMMDEDDNGAFDGGFDPVPVKIGSCYQGRPSGMGIMAGYKPREYVSTPADTSSDNDSHSVERGRRHKRTTSAYSVGYFDESD